MKNEKLFDKTFDSFGKFVNGVCDMRLDNKAGIIDSMGNWILEPIYREIGVIFEDGWIGFNEKVNDSTTKWGIINEKGEVVFEPQFSLVFKHVGDCTLPVIYECDVQIIKNPFNCKKGYVNLRGEIIWKPTK